MTTRGPENPVPQDVTFMKERKLLIPQQRSIIPACDVPDLGELAYLVEETAHVPGVGGYKTGIELANPYGLIEVVRTIRERTTLPIIHDQQKGGNDIPELGPKFAAGLKRAGVDAAILFPFTGPVTQTAWTKALQEEGITVIVGGHMTHPSFLAGETEKGYIDATAPRRIYELAAEMGVRDFVVPGNKPESVSEYRKLLEGLLGEGGFTLYAPGFVAQDGNISETGKVAGENWHAIVGRGIYEKQDMRSAATQLTAQLSA